MTSLTMVTNTWAASIVLLYRRQKVDNPKISYNSNQVYRGGSVKSVVIVGRPGHSEMGRKDKDGKCPFLAIL